MPPLAISQPGALIRRHRSFSQGNRQPPGIQFTLAPKRSLAGFAIDSFPMI